jgi:hypothetical protein
MPNSRLDPPVAQRKSSALRTRVLRRFDSCREVHGGVIGPATEPVLKTVRAFEGVGIDTSPAPPIWKVNRPGVGVRWKRAGRTSAADRDRHFPPSWMPNQSGLWRPFEAGRHRTVWRSTRQASTIFLLTADVPAASEGVKSLRAICAGRSVRNPRGLISRDWPGATPGPATKHGKCHKDRLVPSPRCKRGPCGQEVRFRPLPTMRL